MGFSIEELKKRNSLNFGTQKQEIANLAGSNSTGLSALKKMSNSICSGSRNKDDLELKVKTVSSSIIEETSKIYHQQKVELLFILDKSISCHGTEYATCASYDRLIAREKKMGLPTTVTTILFDGNQQEIVFRKNIEQVGSLKYMANGASTAMYDTMCTNIEKIMNVQDREIDPPKKTIVAIMTDGADNSSQLYTEDATRRIVEKAKNRGWEFLFLGAMEYAHYVGNSLGIDSNNIARIDMRAMDANFRAIEDAIDLVRKNGKIDSSWKNRIQKLTLEDKEQEKRLRLDMK